MRVSQFASAHADTPAEPVEFKQILAAIKGGKWQKYIDELRKLEGKEFTKKKLQLPAFTASGVFDGRGDAALVEASGIVQIDIDGKHNPGTPYSDMWDVVIDCPHVIAAFRSPSGKGIKAFVKCPPDKTQHAGSYYAAVQWLEKHSVKVDTPVCALSQLCFVSSDPHLYYNPKAEVIEPVLVDRDKAELKEYEEERDNEEILAACKEQFPQFESLWEGDMESAGFEDHSIADHALICMLRDNCFSNERVAELFAESGLYRESKWNGRTRDYVFHSLRTAGVVKDLALFDVIEDDPDDPEPEPVKKKGIWRWETIAEIKPYDPAEDESYLIKGMLHLKCVSIVYGVYSGGKTFAALSIGAAIAAGREWCGRKVRQHACMYFGLEGDQGIKRRFQGLKQEGLSRDGDNFARMMFERDQMNLMELAHVKKAIKTIRAYEESCGMKVGLVIIDTLAKAMAGKDENSNMDMGVIVSHAKAIYDATGCNVMLIHHPGKDPTRGPRGGYALPAGVDEMYEISKVEGDPAIRAFKTKKQRDDTEASEIYFRLKVVSLGIDSDGEEKTTCVPEFISYTPPDKKGSKKSPKDDLMTYIPPEGISLDELVQASGLTKLMVNKRVKELEADERVRRKDGTVFPILDPLIEEIEDDEK